MEATGAEHGHHVSAVALGAVAPAHRSRPLGTAQRRLAGVVAPPPAISTPPDSTTFPSFPPSLSRLAPGRSAGSSPEDLEAHHQMPEYLVNAEPIDMNDGCNGEIRAPLDC